MKEIKLLLLELKNFKGAKRLSIEPKGKNLDIYGQNETKKTTLADAWSWLFFDKDTRDQSPQKFDIKPLDENNEPIHGLTTSVKATIELNGSQKTFEKKYYEKWEKKKGSIDEVFTGHTTDCYVSGVGVSKTEFEEEVKKIAPERIFRLLTDPKYYNEQLHWKERRKILTDYIGGISSEEVFEVEDKLSSLAGVLADTTVEKYKDSLKDKLKKLNDEIKKIPIRIDEVNNNLPDVSGISKNEVKSEIESLKKQKKLLEKELSATENGTEIANKEKQLAELETELQQIKIEYRSDYDEKIIELKNEGEKVKDSISTLERKIRNKMLDLKENKNKMQNLKDQINELAAAFREINAEEIQVEDKCPTCGQILPKDQLEDAVKKAKLDKSNRLENIKKQGNSNKSNYIELKEKTKSLNTEINSLKEELSSLENDKDEIYEKLFKIKKQADAYQDNFQYQKKRKEKENIKESIQKIKDNNQDAVNKVNTKISENENEIESLQSKLSKINQYNSGQKRIEELKIEEEKLAEKYQELEKEKYLCEQFEKTRAEMLEEKVNDKFKLAKFKLFEKNINGTIEPTCRTIYKGVPYNTNLNNGHKIIVGIDIINTLSDHYEFRAPIFVDNMESVTQEIYSESQLIKLTAKEDIEELVVLNEGEKDFNKLKKIFGKEKAEEISGMKEAS